MGLRHDDLSTGGERSTGGVSSGSFRKIPDLQCEAHSESHVSVAAQFAPGLLNECV